MPLGARRAIQPSLDRQFLKRGWRNSSFKNRTEKRFTRVEFSGATMALGFCVQLNRRETGDNPASMP